MKFLLKYAVIFIFTLALLLRFYGLATNPPSLNWDEAAWGYNAYTLGQTGRDEFGRFLPITYLESFGDFKPPVYAYLSVIPVALFGLNEFSTRFASALLGSLTVLISYFLVLEIFPTVKRKKYIALSTSLILAISPWHILLSRAAFEANVATFFIVLGIYLFLRATNKSYNVWLFIISLISFVIAMNTFNTPRVFLPIFVPFLFILKRKIIIKNWKKVLLGMILPFLLSIPVMLFVFTPQAQLRFQEVNIFSDLQVIERVNQEIKNDNNSEFSKIIHNRRLAYSMEFVKHYLDNLNPGFLFIHGDGNPRFSIQDVGEIYIWELPFIIIGSLFLFKKKEGSWWMIPVWFILGIIPAATARETPHALRIETVLPTPQIMVAYGLYVAGEYAGRMRFKFINIPIKNVMFSLFGLTVLLCFVYFIHTYFVHYPVTYASEWQYGYKEAVLFAESQKDKYENIDVTTAMGRPYIYFLLYGHYPPDTLQSAKIKRDTFGFVHVDGFGKYKFFDDLPFDQSNVLYINVPNKVPSSAHIIKNFLLPDGNSALVAYVK